MTDAISVIGPGWRATDTSGNIITDGILHFFDAGTSSQRTVYSDSSLSTSLGTTVDCNSGGYPVTSGNSRTLIYTGNTAYKVRLTSATVGGTVWEHDNVLGALDTSDFLTEAAVADRSVVPVSTNRSVTTSDKGKILDVNCSGGDITLTFDDAATLDDGFYVGIMHNGTANQVKITGDGSDTFGIPGANVTGFSLTGRGQGCTVTCDATNFKTDAWTPPLIGGNTGVILIADRLSTPAGSPEAGQRYIVGSSPQGAWSGFAEHDIAEADGFGNWFNYTPATDCGWLAFVQDEQVNYQFIGSAWVEELNTGNIQDYAPGTLIAIIEDQKSSGTAPQTMTTNTDVVRELTTLVYNRDTIVSLASNRFDLPAGTWEMSWIAEIGGSGIDGTHQSFLYNQSDTTEVKRGSSGYVDMGEVDAGDGQNSHGHAVVTIADTKSFEIRHRMVSSGTIRGGYAASLGTEVYCRVVIRRA